VRPPRAYLIAREIEQCDPRDPKDFRRRARLSIFASRETRMLTMCLTKLRLLPTKAEAAAASARGAQLLPLSVILDRKAGGMLIVSARATPHAQPCSGQE
jgi:hypothetical protein